MNSHNKDDFYNHDHFNEDKFYKSRQNRADEKLPVIEENLQVGKTQEFWQHLRPGLSLVPLCWLPCKGAI